MAAAGPLHGGDLGVHAHGTVDVATRCHGARALLPGGGRDPVRDLGDKSFSREARWQARGYRKYDALMRF